MSVQPEVTYFDTTTAADATATSIGDDTWRIEMNYNGSRGGNDVIVAYYECRGWELDGSRDSEQYGWRVMTSCVLGVIALLTVAAWPIFVCIQ